MPAARAGRAPTQLSAPLRAVVGGNTATKLADGLGLRTVEDLLRHYPRRYYERGELTDLSALVPGENATISARVLGVASRKIRPKLHKLDVTVTDGTRDLVVTFFNRPYLEKELTPGVEVLFAGTVETFRRRPRLTNPEYRLGGGDDDDSFAGGLIPVYPATAGMVTWKIARAVRVVLDTLGDIEDPLPATLRDRRGLPPLREALELVHRPTSRADVTRGQARLRWDEAIVAQVALAQRRAARRHLAATPRRGRDDGLLGAFDARLPFELTAGQREVGERITADLAAEHPMHRLLQGEVGSGKTVVALRAMLAVVDSGGQAALLAPTEVLAAQHHRSITAMLGPLAEGGLLGGSQIGTRVVLLTGSQPAAARRRALLDAASGDAGIVVGTHALLQEGVDFHDLGLVVVDEQHRFGVEQRDALRGKAERPPHVLVMTATPIPRTVAMTVFGDLDVSTLTDLPGGRQPIATHVVPAGEKPRHLQRVWERIREDVDAGGQAFVVCPRIGGESSAEDVEEGGEAVGNGAAGNEAAADRRPPVAVLEVAPLLAEGPLAGLRLGVLHGRLPPEARDEVMLRFAGGVQIADRVDVLVATTVVEVGVDVPNATVMVVLDADRFGVCQLHQLRGRVGRGRAPGLALLVTDAPPDSPARARLAAVAATLDGFELSRVDLEQRREGDVLGPAQSGRRSSLRLLSVLRDEDLIREARAEAVRIVDADPELAEHPALRATVAALVAEERADFLEKA